MKQSTNSNSQFDLAIWYKFDELVIGTCNSLDGEEGESLMVDTFAEKKICFWRKPRFDMLCFGFENLGARYLSK